LEDDKMKYSYCEGKNKAWVEPYYCDNYFCDADCDCGLTFKEAKGFVVSYYEIQLERAKDLAEEGY
jgi:hypothetical protein